MPNPFRIACALALASLVAAASVAAQSPGGNAAAAKMKNPVATSAASVTAGAAAYKKYCAFCHGVAGKGDGPLAPKGAVPADLTDAKWDHGGTDGEIYAAIQDGVATTAMVGFKGKMPDRDVWNIVNYLRSLAAKKS